MKRFSSCIGTGTVEVDFYPVDRMIHPDAEIALELWRDRPADGIRIGRDIPSRSMARLLNRVAVCEPASGGGDYLVRLAGNAIIQHLGHNISGEYISEIFDDTSELNARRECLNRALETGMPYAAHIIHRATGMELLRQEAVAFPVTAPNGTDRWALVFVFYL